MSEEIQYKLESFEGPLDLLLSLIQKHKLNIYDINISELLEQYTETLKDITEIEDMDGASEFLEMAARLVYIKTAMLLPKYDDEGEKLRQELQGELIEYQACKDAAAEFKKHYCGNSIFSRPPITFEVDNTYTHFHAKEELLNAYLSALGRKQRKLPPPVTAFTAVVQQKLVSVPSRAIILLRKLYRKTRLKWIELFKGSDRSESVAMFLAVLDLVKNGRINISDDNELVSLNEIQKHNRNKREKVGEEIVTGTV